MVGRMSAPRRFLAIVAAVSVTTLGLAACQSGGGGDRVTIYSGRTQELIEPLLQRFAEEEASPSTSAGASRPTSRS